MKQQQGHDQTEIDVRARVQLLRCFFEAFLEGGLPACEFEPLCWYARRIVVIPLLALRKTLDASGLFMACEQYRAPVLGKSHDPVEAGEQEMRDVVAECLKSLDGWLQEDDAHWFGPNVDRLPREPAAEETPRAEAATSRYSAADMTGHIDPQFWARARVQLSRTFLLACCDGRFGSLTLDRSIDTFCGRALWLGTKINLNLDGERGKDLDAALEFAETLWANSWKWQSRAYACAVTHLLDLKNSTWLEEDEVTLDAPTFAERMIIESIRVSPGGAVEFWFNDGDLFWGHMIQVSGTLSEGLTDADICG